METIPIAPPFFLLKFVLVRLKQFAITISDKLRFIWHVTVQYHNFVSFLLGETTEVFHILSHILFNIFKTPVR